MRHITCTARAVVLLAILVAAIAIGACGGNPAAPVDPSVLPSMNLMLAEKSLGSPTAPNTIIEFSSFTCPHCANFCVNTFPQLKLNYIDKDVVRFVFVNSPSDQNPDLNKSLDLAAAMLARCAGDRYFDAVGAIFTSQGTWYGASTTAPLENVMRQFGMSQPVIDACKASTTLRDGILKMKQDALQQYNYQYVPTFIINGTPLVGDRPLSEIVGLFY
jgi:protein-disulfide isomerase